MKVQINVSVGELIDKITILEIKLRNIKDPIKWTNCQTDWRQLCETLIQVEIDGGLMVNSKETDRKTELYFELTTQLRAANQRLWDIEDEIRDLERTSVPDRLSEYLTEGRDLGAHQPDRETEFFHNALRFIELARMVYRTNDGRCRLKKELDVLFGSELTEEKSYKEMK